MQIYFPFKTRFLKILTLLGQINPICKENVNFFNSSEPFGNADCITFRLLESNKVTFFESLNFDI